MIGGAAMTDVQERVGAELLRPSPPRPDTAGWAAIAHAEDAQGARRSVTDLPASAAATIAAVAVPPADNESANRLRAFAGMKFIAGEPMKPATKVVAGFCVHLHRRADLLGAAGVHHDHPLRERHRLDLVVRDVEARRAEAPVQLLDLDAHLHAQLGVEVGQRLVEQEHLPARARWRGPSRRAGAGRPRAARGLRSRQRPELEDLRRAASRAVDVGLGKPRILQPVRHVVVHAHVRIERVVLEHHRDVAVLGLQRR